MSEVPLPFDENSLRIQELAYGLKVRDVMTRKIFAVTRQCTMREVQTIMKSNGVSGVPVVDGGHVVGMVSMHDIMNAFEHGHLQDGVAKHMSASVQTLSEEVPVTFAMSAFSRYSFRRFPVVNKKNELVGIITPRNINLALIRELSRQLNEIEEQGSVLERGEVSTVYHRVYRLDRYDFEHAGNASAALKRELKQRGVSLKTTRRAAIASYELEINIVAHSHGGSFTHFIDGNRVRITANDFGPGIPDVEKAMSEGFSTANDWIRSQGFGAGMGLPNAKRVSDEFEIQSGVEMGTMVKSIIYLKEEPPHENQ
jgi:CBS domain-containing protein/anti-sigma regulatory factor (Ser/Thr protein kinase)